MAVASLLIRLVAIAGMVLTNAFFVAAEFALVRVRRTRLEELAAEKHDGAAQALSCVDEMGEYLSTTQIGVTISSLGVGWIGEDTVAGLLTGIFPHAMFDGVIRHSIAVVFSFLLVTMMHVVFGELIPKNLAIGKAEEALLLLVRPLKACHGLLRPIRWVFMGLAGWILRRMGHTSLEEAPLSETELKLLVEDSHDDGVVTKGEAQIIARAFEFADRRASEIMIPASKVDFISLSQPFEQNLQVAQKNMHARLPLSSGNLDEVVGVVNMKDVWPHLMTERSNKAFERVARPPIRVAENMSQEEILKLFQDGRGHMGIVRGARDQRTVGIVTLEDVLESLVGNIRERRV